MAGRSDALATICRDSRIPAYFAGPGAFPGGATTAVAASNAAGIALAPSVTVSAVGTVALTAAASGATPVSLPTITVAAPPATLSADVSATRALVAGKVVLTVSATNTGAAAATILLKTKYGTRTFTEVAPWATVSQAFKTYLASIPAGDATVTLTSAAGQRSYSAPYAAL